MTLPNRPYVPHIALLLAMLFWSSSFVTTKIALSEYTPMEVMSGRMLVGALICLPLLKALIGYFKDKRIRKVLILSIIFEPCLYFLFESYALTFTSSSQASMIFSTIPLFMGISAWFVLGEKLSKQACLGFTIAVTGAVWLSLAASSTEGAPNPLLGNLLELGAVFSVVIYTLCVRYLVRFMPPFHLTAMMPFAGFLFFTPLAFVTGSHEAVILAIDIPTWLPEFCIIYLGSFTSLGGYGLYNFALTRMPAGQVAAYNNLVPVMALAMGIFFLGEIVTGVQYLASALVIIGIILSQTAKTSE